MQTDLNFHPLRVAVTGGASGLGLALVRLLVARGARVAFIARTADSVARIASETGARGIIGDVGRIEDVYPLAMQITGNLGGLDAFVNNASSLGPTPLVPLADTENEDFERALAVNLLGPFRLIKALYGALTASAREGRGAAVINVSSDAAVNAYPGWGAYGARSRDRRQEPQAHEGAYPCRPDRPRETRRRPPSPPRPRSRSYVGAPPCLRRTRPTSDRE